MNLITEGTTVKIKRENLKDIYTFSSVTELSLFLGIDRETLHERAKARGIELNGTYSEEDLSALRPEKNSALSQLNTEVDPKTEIELLKMKLEMLESELGFKDQQLDDRKQHIETLKSTLSKAEENFEKAQVSVDQQQHLQLATLQQLDKATSRVQRIEMQAEQKKHWWNFGRKSKGKETEED
ncbi:hypothetical protein SAMN05216341_10671 [Leuconostocaceae bacterium R-53105]|uniref:DUF536 domain-containing protein n=1 Tax=Convivina intestini TaxID=1505726 RepID=A0A2U1D9K0_9LACO|nr:hypothetical protein C7384_10472 [Convivina intestini]CAH1855139.1 hypothetical protein R078131_01132 [Convivina intestini]CAH1855551.1 hypothetical protein R077811_01089 [Convivina intestini]SDB94389.1 hypothetical protein SAMN05216341_10671 [Leuconostocaceae bacterium R-53105]